MNTILHDTYLDWLNSLKEGDSYSWLRHPAYGNKLAEIHTRTVQRRTKTQIIFTNGLRVNVRTGYIVGSSYRKLEQPASSEDIQLATLAYERHLIVRRVQNAISDPNIADTLSLDALLRIEKILHDENPGKPDA